MKPQLKHERTHSFLTPPHPTRAKKEKTKKKKTEAWSSREHSRFDVKSAGGVRWEGGAEGGREGGDGGGTRRHQPQRSQP